MDTLIHLMKFLHIMGFVFMSIPLFNLIVVNERALFGAAFNYDADRYMENIIRRGATRCFVFQGTVLISGLLLIALGPLGLPALWTNGILLAKTVLLFTLMGLLSYVHLSLQPAIDGLLAQVTSAAEVPENFAAQLKPHRVRRKQLATVCLFLVITTIILGLQVYSAFPGYLTVTLIALAGIFAWRVNRTLVRFGWF